MQQKQNPMLKAQRYSFTERTDNLGRSVIMPYLPLTLMLGNRFVEVTALLDTGASVNVLPYEIGIQLGVVWENQTVSIPLSGNLAQSESRGLVVSAEIGQFSPILLAFAWTELRDAPVILTLLLVEESVVSAALATGKYQPAATRLPIK
jgi:hypothetical protein